MWLEFLLASLAVWRISHLIAKEDGPFDVFGRLKEKAGAVYYGPENRWVVDEGIDGKREELGWLITCPLCLSIWFAIPAALWVSGLRWDAVVTWLAISAVASIIELGVPKNV